jgi:hypothetical protein
MVTAPSACDLSTHGTKAFVVELVSKNRRLQGLLDFLNVQDI